MTSDRVIWTDAISDAADKLEQKGIDDAKINAEYLAMYIIGIWNKKELRRFLKQEITEVQFSDFQKLISRRLTYEPLQHIIGETEFYGLRLLTSPAALIPRPDTEILVETALREASSYPKNSLRILDIGTGSGAIALALASKLPDAQIIGIDISSEAIILAKKNQQRLKIINVDFKVADIFQNDLADLFPDQFDIIISNPPYISIEEFQTLDSEVRLFDPRVALTDEGDGYTFYKRITEIAPDVLKKNGRILLEVSYSGAQKVEDIFKILGFSALPRIKDLQGIERVVVLRFD